MVAARAPELYTVAAVAKMYDISKATVFRAIKDETLPALKPGGSWQWFIKSVDLPRSWDMIQQMQRANGRLERKAIREVKPKAKAKKVATKRVSIKGKQEKTVAQSQPVARKRVVLGRAAKEAARKAESRRSKTRTAR